MQILFAATVGVRTAQTSSIESHPHESRFSPQPRLDQPIIPNQRKKKNQKAKKKKEEEEEREENEEINRLAGLLSSFRPVETAASAEYIGFI